MPAVATGDAGPAPPSAMTLSASATLDGAPCRITFAGYAPQLIGVYQINLEIPPVSGRGNAPLTIEVGGGKSNMVAVAVE